MKIELKCLRCNGTNVKPSDLQSTGRIYSRPKRAKFVAIFTTGAPVSALTCLDCGHVELLVEPEQARALLKTG